jgi:CarD family transcriptional regulator
MGTDTKLDIVDNEIESSFHVGQKAVYGSHGVGTIEGIQECDVGGTRQNFYVVNILSTGAKIMVPTGAARMVGLRSVVPQEQVEQKVFDVLRAKCQKSTATWNRRFRTFNDKLSKGDVSAIAEVFRDLSSLGSEKELSFGEKKMLERARQMLVTELAIAKGSDETTIEGELRTVLGKIGEPRTKSMRAVGGAALGVAAVAAACVTQAVV